MKRLGPRHSPGEKHLMAQVAKVFTAKRKEKDGAKRASKELGISLASFYKYAAGDDLPRMELLRAAQQKWKDLKWDLIDVSEIIERKEVLSPEQYVLSFLQEVRTEDVEIAKIGPRRASPAGPTEHPVPRMILRARGPHQSACSARALFLGGEYRAIRDIWRTPRPNRGD